jgi:hypothetical protein
MEMEDSEKKNEKNYLRLKRECIRMEMIEKKKKMLFTF